MPGERADPVVGRQGSREPVELLVRQELQGTGGGVLGNNENDGGTEMNKQINWTETQLDDRLNITAESHIALGLERAAGLAMEVAVESFRQGNENHASAFRAFSGSLSTEAARCRERQKGMQRQYNAAYKD